MGGYEPRIEVAVKMHKNNKSAGSGPGDEGFATGWVGIGVGGCEPITEGIVKRA